MENTIVMCNAIESALNIMGSYDNYTNVLGSLDSVATEGFKDVLSNAKEGIIKFCDMVLRLISGLLIKVRDKQTTMISPKAKAALEEAMSALKRGKDSQVLLNSVTKSLETFDAAMKEKGEKTKEVPIEWVIAGLKETQAAANGAKTRVKSLKVPKDADDSTKAAYDKDIKDMRVFLTAANKIVHACTRVIGSAAVTGDPSKVKEKKS